MRLLSISLMFFALSLGMEAFAQAPAPQTPEVFESRAGQALLIDMSSGAVLYEKNGDAAIEPANMSKLMAMTLVFEALQRGDITVSSEFTVSQDAWRRGGALAGGSTMYAALNSHIKVSDLMRGAIIQSGNDSVLVLAEGLAGSESNFVDTMNKRAQELGLKQTHFTNATGLADEAQLMSLRDLSKLAINIISNFSVYYPLYSEHEFTWNKIKQQNRNPLLSDYPGADGLVTGSTKASGFGLVGSAQRDGRRLVIVISGLPSSLERKQEAQKLLDWGFKQFKPVKAYAAGDTVASLRVWGGNAPNVTIVAGADAQLNLTDQERQSIVLSLDYNGPLRAPIKAGQEIGHLKFMLGDKPMLSIPVQAASDVSESRSLIGRAVDSLRIYALGG